MKLKKEYAILIIIIILLSSYLLLYNRDRTHYRLPDIPKVSEMNITKLEIGKSGNNVILNKKDSSWYIDPKGYPADKAKVKNMLDVIKKLKLTDLVSESKNYIRYDLNDNKKITVTAWSGNSLKIEFEIGKPATTSRHTYIKIAGNPNVYHARGNFRAKFDQTSENLRDMIVMSLEQNDIREILIKKQNKEMLISQKQVDVKEKDIKDINMIWYTKESEEVDKDKLNRLISSLSLLRCEKYINDAKKEDFNAPVINLILKGKKEYFFSVFAKKDKDAKNYPAISSENDYTFLLSDYTVNNMETMIEEIMNSKVKERGRINFPK